MGSCTVPGAPHSQQSLSLSWWVLDSQSNPWGSCAGHQRRTHQWGAREMGWSPLNTSTVPKGVPPSPDLCCASAQTAEGSGYKQCLKYRLGTTSQPEFSHKQPKQSPCFFLRAVSACQSSKVGNRQHRNGKACSKIPKITGFLRNHNYHRGDDNNPPFPAAVSSHSFISHSCLQLNKNGFRCLYLLVGGERRRRANQI